MLSFVQGLTILRILVAGAAAVVFPRVVVFPAVYFCALFCGYARLAAKRKRLRSFRHFVRFVLERRPPLRLQPGGHHADAEEDAVVAAQAAPRVAHSFLSSLRCQVVS